MENKSSEWNFKFEVFADLIKTSPKFPASYTVVCQTSLPWTLIVSINICIRIGNSH